MVTSSFDWPADLAACEREIEADCVPLGGNPPFRIGDRVVQYDEPQEGDRRNRTRRAGRYWIQH